MRPRHWSSATTSAHKTGRSFPCGCEDPRSQLLIVEGVGKPGRSLYMPTNSARRSCVSCPPRSGSRAFRRARLRASPNDVVIAGPASRICEQTRTMVRGVASLRTLSSRHLTTSRQPVPEYIALVHSPSVASVSPMSPEMATKSAIHVDNKRQVTPYDTAGAAMWGGKTAQAGSDTHQQLLNAFTRLPQSWSATEGGLSSRTRTNRLSM